MKKLSLALFLLLPELAFGHHGISNFDLNSDVGFAGTITEIAFVNPHSWIYVDVQADDGSLQQWKCELRGSTVLRRSGWNKEMFEVGAQVSITGSPDRFEENTCYMGTIVFADGLSMNRYGQLQREVVAEQEPRQQRLANGDPNIAGDWASEQGVMTDPRGISGAFLPISIAGNYEPGEVPSGGQAFPGARGTAVSLADDPVQSYWTRGSAMALTEAGREVMEGFDGASAADNPRLRCEATNILFDWTFDTMVNRIEQSATTITLHYGFMGLVRTIHMNEDSFPESLALSITGYSIGRWENDVLIVNTQGLLPGILSADAATKYSEQIRITELFSLNADGSLLRQYAAEDPLYFEGQYRGADTVNISDLAYEVVVCDDRSYNSGE